MEIIFLSLPVFENSFSFDFYWSKNGTIDSFYLPPDGKGWFWPKACVYHENRLHILLSQLDNWGPNPAWDYGPIAAWHAIIQNPTDEPTNWKIKYNKTPFMESTLHRNITFDASILRDEDYFYIYGFNEFIREEADIRDFIQSRVKVNQFENYDSYEFYQNIWTNNFTDASLLFDGIQNFSSSFSISL